MMTSKLVKTKKQKNSRKFFFQKNKKNQEKENLSTRPADKRS